MQGKRYSSASKSHNSGYSDSSFNTYTPSNERYKGILKASNYDSNSRTNYSAYDNYQNAEDVPNIQLNLRDITVSPQNMSSYATGGQKTPSKNSSVVHSAKKELFTPEKK